MLHRLSRTLLFAALCGVSLATTPTSARAGDAAETDAEAEPERAPAELVHYSIDGKRVILSDYVPVPGATLPPVPKLRGPVVLVFGAHWCAPCKEVMAELDARRAELEAAGAHVLYVHVDDVDRAKGLDNDAIRKAAREMASDEAYRDVIVLLGGDNQELSTWMGDPEHDSLPGVVLLTRDGEVAARSGADDFPAALDTLLGTSTD